MNEREVPSRQPQETERKRIDIKGLFDRYLSSEDFHSYYKLNSQILYAQDIRRFLKFSTSRNQVETDMLPELIQQYAIANKTPVTYRTLVAVKGAAAWGKSKHLLNPNLDIEFQPQIHRDRSPFINFKVNPLTNSELQQLIKATDEKPRDKALILTVLTTRASTDTIRELTKENVAIDENGAIIVSAKTFKQEIPAAVAPALISYVHNLKPGPLFPNHWQPEEPLSKQAMHLIFKKYKKEIGLPKLSHAILVRTGVQMYGKPAENKS